MNNLGPHKLTPIKDLLYFADLSPEAKEKALREILNSDAYCIEKKIQEAKTEIRGNVNACVNNRHFVARILRDIKHLRVVEQNRQKLVSYIEANLCMFHPDGTYHPFMISKPPQDWTARK